MIASRRIALFFVLSCLTAIPNSLRAADPSDLGDILRAIGEIVDRMVHDIHDWNKEKIKGSVSALSKRMSRIAGLKKSFAEFLADKPATFAEFTREDRIKANGQLQTITEEIGGLKDDLTVLDSDWAAKNPTLNTRLTEIANDKALKWPRIGPSSTNLDVKAFRQWLIDEAKTLEETASELKSKLPA